MNLVSATFDPCMLYHRRKCFAERLLKGEKNNLNLGTEEHYAGVRHYLCLHQFLINQFGRSITNSSPPFIGGKIPVGWMQPLSRVIYFSSSLNITAGRFCWRRSDVCDGHPDGTP